MRVKDIYRATALVGTIAFYYWQESVSATIAFGTLIYLVSEIAVDQYERNKK